MATHHAEPNEVVDLRTWAMDTVPEKSKVVFRAKELEVARLVLPAGKLFKEHRVSGPITIQVLSGDIIFEAMGCSQEVKSGQFLHLLPGEPHALEAKVDSVVLLTIIF